MTLGQRYLWHNFVKPLLTQMRLKTVVRIVLKKQRRDEIRDRNRKQAEHRRFVAGGIYNWSDHLPCQRLAADSHHVRLPASGRHCQRSHDEGNDFALHHSTRSQNIIEKKVA